MTTTTPTRQDPLVHIRKASASITYCGERVSIGMDALMHAKSNCFRCLSTYSKDMEKEADRLREKATMLYFAAEKRGIWTDPT